MTILRKKVLWAAMASAACWTLVVTTAPRGAYANSFVRMDFNLTLQNRSRDTLFIELFDDRPLTRDNFLMYVNGGHFDDSLMHRLARNFVLQGGGYYPELQPEPAPLNVSLNPFAEIDNDNNPATPQPTVNNEFGNTPMRSNVRGTLAMAKLADNPNSATSEFFFNTVNNSANLDNVNGGFTVFAQVAGDGMALIDAFNGLSIVNLNPDFDDNGMRDGGWPFFNRTDDGVPVLGNNLLILEDAEHVDYLGGGSVTTVPVTGLTFGLRDAFIDTGATFTGTGELIVASNRTLGIREGVAVTRPVVNLGTLAPGSQLGSVTVQAFRQEPGASLEIQLRVTDPTIPDNQEFDHLAVTGAALLGGDLDVSLLNNFMPAAGNSFTVLTAGVIADSFDAVNLPTLNPGLAWLVNTSPTAIALAVVAPDYNVDGIVNAGDLTVWRGLNGQTGASLAADGNRDGRVDGADLLIWQRTLGKNVGVPAAMAIPEPAAATLLILGAVVGLRAIVRRR